MTFGNNLYYEGNWSKNAIEGHGKAVFLNKDEYEGNWLNNLKNG